VIQLILAGTANFCFIGLKAFQQRNVVHNDRLLVLLTSNLLAVAEVYVVFTIASVGMYWPLVVTVGISGGLGCLAAMWLHDKWRAKRWQSEHQLQGNG